MTALRVLLYCGAVVMAGTMVGCGESTPSVSFDTARSSARAVAIEGELQVGSVSRTTGRPTRFTLLEAGSGSQMPVTASEAVPVPSNITTAHSVRVTGTYDASKHLFIATSVEVRALNRDEQPRG